MLENLLVSSRGSAIVGVEPAFRHFHRFSPLFVHLLAFWLRNLRLEDCPIFFVNLFQLIELFPHVDRKASNNCRTKSSGLTHDWSVDRDRDDISLCLRKLSYRLTTSGIRKRRKNILAYRDRNYSSLRQRRARSICDRYLSPWHRGWLWSGSKWLPLLLELCGLSGCIA